MLAGGENPARWACFPALQTEKRPQISPLSPPHSRAETMQIFKGQSLDSFLHAAIKMYGIVVLPSDWPCHKISKLFLIVDSLFLTMASNS